MSPPTAASLAYGFENKSNETVLVFALEVVLLTFQFLRLVMVCLRWCLHLEIPILVVMTLTRSVSKHRWTGRYEAHLWDKLSWNVTQNKRGKQVYLGAYDNEEAAAIAYDLAALMYWGTSTITNFHL